MGKITGFSQNAFKSAEYIYSKIKRDFKGFGYVNLIDDSDFPLYTAEVLKKLGNSAYKEEDAILFIKDGKAQLPIDFKNIYAAYKCHDCNKDDHLQIYQGRSTYEYKLTCDTLCRNNGCVLECENEQELVQRVTVRQYVNDTVYNHEFNNFHLLKLSPNVKDHCSDNCLNFSGNHHHHNHDEITINNKCIHTNFHDGAIFLQYYAFPQDENGLPMVPDILEVEKAIEWYIKKELLTNLWFTGDLPNAQNLWQKAEVEYEKWMAEARFIGKLPAFSTLVNSVRNQRGINAVQFFSQQDRNRRR